VKKRRAGDGVNVVPSPEGGNLSVDDLHLASSSISSGLSMLADVKTVGPGPRGDPWIDPAGWLAGAEHCPSPNCDERPEDTSIDLLVIHNISLPPGEFGGTWIDDLFLGRLDPGAHPYFAIAHAAGRVSTHLLIRRDGGLVQYVPFSRRAWHAGRSCYAGRERCNDFSIGIELEGTDDLPFEPAQYRSLAHCTRVILAHYPAITPYRITGHSDIAPGRKTDPGPCFDWGYYRGLISASAPTAPVSFSPEDTRLDHT
jgi:AmpD protein